MTSELADTDALPTARRRPTQSTAPAEDTTLAGNTTPVENTGLVENAELKTSTELVAVSAVIDNPVPPEKTAPAPAIPARTMPAPAMPAPAIPAPAIPAPSMPALDPSTEERTAGSDRDPEPVTQSPAHRRRVRDRLAGRIVSPRGPSIRPELEPLIAVHKAAHAKADIRLLQRTYEVAERQHRGQMRRSGDPYITHPIAVAMILAELGMDSITLAAALLHDTVEDTGLSLDSIVRDFGGEVGHLVNGVTKLDKVKFGEAAEAETIRKMIVAMARDPRVLVIKLADRLHNMRTLRFLPPAKQERKARETLEVLAPLAHRLGMNTVKWELEDLSFATLYPKRYDEIVRQVADRAPSRDTYLAEVIDRVGEDLKSGGIKAKLTGRPKHYYSIYQKMIVRGRDFTDIHDLVGIRILVDSVRDCYATLGVVHANWQPVPGRFKDYIAMPKFNMYQSLHTTVIGPGGKPVELQIRSESMHRTAEFGIAAHWKYKEVGGIAAGPSAGSDEMAWLRQMLDWQREAQPADEFLDHLRFDLRTNEVLVFTPVGDVISLPAGSTPVDFAYAVHTEVGHHCVGARVNGKLVALESTLENGNTVEVFTSKNEGAGPSRDWLNFVVSPRAKTKIRQWFAKERREDAIESGKKQLSRSMRKSALPLQRLLGGDALLTIAAEMHLADVSALYAAIGEGQASAQSVVARLVATLGGPDGAVEDIAETIQPERSPGRSVSGGDAGVVVKGVSDVWVKLARCCTPVPGDEILGFVTRGGGVSIHRLSCTNASALLAQPARLLEVEWAPSSASVFVVSIQVEALDRSRLLSDVSRVLAEERVNILSASVSTDRNRVAVSKFTFEMAEAKHLGHLLRAVRNVEGVYDVYRIHAAS